MNSLDWQNLILAAACTGSMKTLKGMTASGRSFRAEGVDGAGQSGLDAVADDIDFIDPARSESSPLEHVAPIVRVEAEDPVRALEIGSVHAGKRSLLRI
jgi:hypothetical protein